MSGRFLIALGTLILVCDVLGIGFMIYQAVKLVGGFSRIDLNPFYWFEYLEFKYKMRECPHPDHRVNPGGYCGDCCKKTGKVGVASL